MKNFIQVGERITWTNGTGTDVASGDLVRVHSLLGVACVDIANGESGALAVEGVFELPKVGGVSGHAIAQGESIIYDLTALKFDNKDLSQASGDITGVAIAWEAATSAATTVRVKLCNPGVIHA